MPRDKKIREETKTYATVEEALNAKHEKARKFYGTVNMNQVMALLNK